MKKFLPVCFFKMVLLLLIVGSVNLEAATSNFTVSSSTLPDVVVTSVTYNPTTGQLTSIVTNQGASATPVDVYVGVSYSVDGIYRTWGSVKGPLAAGTSTSIGTGGGAYFIPNGPHTIEVFADDVNRFIESNETNNKLSQSITVGLPALPDVIATSLIYNESTGMFTSILKNQGTSATPADKYVGVAYYVDGIYKSWGSVYGSLAAGASVEINTQGGAFFMPSGSHTIEVFADDVNRFTESNETNNKLALSITVGKATLVSPLPDVVVTNISYDSITGKFTSTIKNQGTRATPADKVVGVGYSVDGSFKTWGSVNGPLAAGASVTIGTDGGPYYILTGTHSIEAHVDDINRFTESNEANNKLLISTSVDSTSTTTTTDTTPTFTAPILINPVNPIDYGAKCDGVTDDSAAFQKAVNAGDVLIPAKTCLINKTVYVSTSHKHIECSKGAILKHTDPFTGNMFRIIAWDAPITDISIINCQFIGTNTEAPQYFEADQRHWDIPIESMNTVNNIHIAGNTFERFFGQSMFQSYSPTYAGSNIRVEYNTFKSCGYYGPVLVAATNSYIGHNTMIDCAAGVENDNSIQASGGNIIEYNTLKAIYGYGAPDMNASILLTGGGAGGANYSTNIVRYNTVSGVGSASRGSLPSLIYQNNPTGPAQYIGNSCTSGCIESK